MGYKYIGWVPCVSGRLFYEYTHCGLGDSPKHHINHFEKDLTSDLYHRLIIISSIVDWKDGKDKKTAGTYKVIMMGHKASDEINVTGMVAIYPNNISDPKTDLIEKKILRIKKSAANEENITILFNELENIIKNFNNDKFYRVNYLLESPGFIQLSYDDTKDADYTEEHKYTITRQAYYYVKYAMHRHTHHHDKAESLTTIHSLNIDKSRIGIKLLNDLRKSLVQLKRDFEPYNCNNIYHASGITSYAKSLAESCLKEKYLEKIEYESEKSYFDNVKSSLEVMSGVVEKNIAKRTMVSGNARALILFALSITMPLVLVYKDKIQEIVKQNDDSIFIIDTFSKIVSSDKNIIVTASALVVFYFIYKSQHINNGSSLLSLKRYRDILDAIVHSRRNASILLLLLLTISSSMIIYSLAKIIN